jgi:biopolymer transport protein ExbB/TolQ
MNELLVSPLFANALEFAFEKATMEGKVTITLLAIVSMLSWTVMIQKGRQLLRASRAGKKFYSAYRGSRDPMDLFRNKADFTGAPAYEIYLNGAEEVSYHLQNNPVVVGAAEGSGVRPPTDNGEPKEGLNSRADRYKVSVAAFESFKAVLERSASAQAISLEKGMIVLSTAVAGGPFIGLLGTVWGVMETFSGIAKVQAASLTAMAPGVAGALIATVVGLFVAIPAMFAYNYMITVIRAITQELDNFNTEYATAVEHAYVDNRSIADEVASALRQAFPKPPVPSAVIHVEPAVNV